LQLSVAIPTFNRSFTITKTLDSLLRQTHKEFEVIIVDDGSTDATESVVQPYLRRNIRYIKTAHHGTPHAWNLGVEESQQDFVFLLGDDVTLEPDCLAILNRTIETVDKRNLGAVAPRLIYAPNITNPTQGRAYRKYAYLQKSTGDVAGSFNVEAQKTVEVPILHGYSVVQKEAFSNVGRFDEKTYTGNYYREETDLWLRFGIKGYKLYYEPRAKIYCQKSLTKGGQWSNVNGKLLTYEYYVIRNHSKFLHKFYGKQRLLMLPTFTIRRLYTRLTELHDGRQ
jgi:glycosyltransferase involved in cell wall biosynthesis